MNKNKMKLEEAKEYLPFIIRDLEANYYNQNFINALKTIKKELQNSIPKKNIEDKLNELLDKLAIADLGDFYDEVRDIKEELLDNE